MGRILSRLSGAIIDEININLVGQTLVITCHVTDGDAAVHRKLECKSLSEFRFFNAIPGPWKYAELTEIHMDKAPSGEAQLEIVVWSEDAGLTIRAETVELDGQAVTQ